jgi:hypothetical protein
VVKSFYNKFSNSLYVRKKLHQNFESNLEFGCLRLPIGIATRKRLKGNCSVSSTQLVEATVSENHIIPHACGDTHERVNICDTCVAPNKKFVHQYFGL